MACEWWGLFEFVSCHGNTLGITMHSFHIPFFAVEVWYISLLSLVLQSHCLLQYLVLHLSFFMIRLRIYCFLSVCLLECLTDWGNSAKFSLGSKFLSIQDTAGVPLALKSQGSFSLFLGCFGRFALAWWNIRKAS